MNLTGVHFLLTYQCTFECDHCFVWGSPWQSGIFTFNALEKVLDQAIATGTVRSIYFEGGEPFLFYALLLNGVEAAVRRGFDVGIVSNAYWATSREDALHTLKPFKGLISDLSLSSDRYHSSEETDLRVQHALQAAEMLEIPVGTIQIAQPEALAAAAAGQLPAGGSGVMYRGRAASKLAERASHKPWESFTACPHEDLREPGRVHVDPFGNIHICQGILLGNLFESSLAEIASSYQPGEHPITGPLLAGGPAQLVKTYQVAHAGAYADACHLCYETRQALRGSFPAWLGPDAVYGKF